MGSPTTYHLERQEVRYLRSMSQTPNFTYRDGRFCSPIGRSRLGTGLVTVLALLQERQRGGTCRDLRSASV